MFKLTQARRLILISACEHPSGLATRPAHLKPAHAIKMAAFFSENLLAKEIRAKADSLVWREDNQGRSYALKILKAGRKAIDLSKDDDAGVEDISDDNARTPYDEQAADHVSATFTQRTAPKSHLIVGLMQRPDGATIDDLITATGWLPHTTRAALSGLRKKGIAIHRQPGGKDKASVYRIAPPASRHAA